jgi:hypothetical protein
MGRDKRNEQREPRFTKWVYAHRLLPAWKALTPGAREVFFHLSVRCFAEGKGWNNNGHVYRSPRKLSEDTGFSVKTVSAGLADLQAKGWIVCTNPWERGTEGNGRTAHFRLTMLPTDSNLPTREPEAWTDGQDFPVKVYKGYLPKPRRGRIKNVTHPPNRTQYCARVGRTQPDDTDSTAPE